MVNRIPFVGFNISLCFYPLKEKKSIRRVILGFNRSRRRGYSIVILSKGKTSYKVIRYICTPCLRHIAPLCSLRNLGIRYRKRPRGRFPGRIYINIKGSSAMHLQRFVFLLPLYFPGKASGQRLHRQQTISVQEENPSIDHLTPRSFFLQSREQ